MQSDRPQGKGVAVVNYIDLLTKAVDMFYVRDAERLLRRIDGQSACERCIVNCIARYLWRLIQRRGLAADVDVEYNLDCESEDPKRIRLEACRYCSRAECLMHAFVNGRIRCRESREVMRGDPLIYPDLIVHVRGSGRNYLAVEFKKEDEARKRTGNYKNAAKWDMAKLQYLSCRERMDGVDPYEDAVFVVLKSNEADFILPEQFPVAEGIWKASTVLV